jgi:hypothetical protein
MSMSGTIVSIFLRDLTGISPSKWRISQLQPDDRCLWQAGKHTPGFPGNFWKLFEES